MQDRLKAILLLGIGVGLSCLFSLQAHDNGSVGDWAAVVLKCLMGLVVAYLALFSPNTVAYWLVELVPITSVPLGLLAFYCITHSLWAEAIALVFLIRVGVPIVANSNLRDLANDLKRLSASENQVFVRISKWFGL